MLDFITAENGFPYFCCKNLIFYLYQNHQHIRKECSQTENTHLLYRKRLPM